ncbi:MAG: hypothetical protein EA361_02485 [Bacteroidetes bacterium]|nr:MAG: hypothetical protein EA361_02485 [Bacteroidota bacterium]
MKKLVLIIAAVFATSFLFVACEDDDKMLESKDFFVAFEQLQGVLSLTSSDTLRIPVYVAATTGPAVTVNFDVLAQSTAVENTDFEFLGGKSVVFENGTGVRHIQVVSKAGSTAPLNATLEIKSNSANYNIGFGFGENRDSLSHHRYTITFTP